MTTKLQAPLKRELSINGREYTLTISPAGLHLHRRVAKRPRTRLDRSCWRRRGAGDRTKCFACPYISNRAGATIEAESDCYAIAQDLAKILGDKAIATAIGTP